MSEKKEAAEKTPSYSTWRTVGGLAAIFAVPVALFVGSAVVKSGSWLYPFLELMAPRDPADFWVFVTAEGTLGLAILAYRGLASLRLAKYDVSTRFKRELRQAAVDQCERFAFELIPEWTKVTKDGTFSVIVKSHAEVDFANRNEEHHKRAAQWYGALSPDARIAASELMNHVEAWCMHFTSGVADRDLAYGPCATPFFSLVMQFYPYLLMMRDGDRISGMFPNTVDLFAHWAKQREKENAEDETGPLMDEILLRLREVQKKRILAIRASRKAPKELPPQLGTDSPDLL